MLTAAVFMGVGVGAPDSRAYFTGWREPCNAVLVHGAHVTAAQGQARGRELEPHQHRHLSQGCLS